MHTLLGFFFLFMELLALHTSVELLTCRQTFDAKGQQLTSTRQKSGRPDTTQTMSFFH